MCDWVFVVDLFVWYFRSKVDIWNVNCARLCTGNSIHFRRTNWFSCESVKVFEKKMSLPEGDSNPRPSDSCRMLQPFELSGPEICCPMFLKTCSCYIDIFEEKLTFEMLTVRGQKHWFFCRSFRVIDKIEVETDSFKTLAITQCISLQVVILLRWWQTPTFKL